MNGHGGVAGVIFMPTSLVGVTWDNSSSPDFQMGADSESILYAINDAGSAAGMKDSNNTPTQRAVVVTGGVVHDIAGLVGQGSIATSINNAGRACGWAWNVPRAFIYDAPTNTVVAHIDPLPGAGKSFAGAINALGHVAGACDNDHGFFY